MLSRDPSGKPSTPCPRELGPRAGPWAVRTPVTLGMGTDGTPCGRQCPRSRAHASRLRRGPLEPLTPLGGSGGSACAGRSPEEDGGQTQEGESRRTGQGVEPGGTEQPSSLRRQPGGRAGPGRAGQDSHTSTDRAAAQNRAARRAHTQTTGQVTWMRSGKWPVFGLCYSKT